MLVDSMDPAFYSPRVYVVAETDTMSGKRALSRELARAGTQVCRVPAGACSACRPPPQHARCVLR